MENHHEETEPTNKWVATPIVMAFIFISVVIFFITLAARGKDKDKDIKTKEHGTEQHDAIVDVPIEVFVQNGKFMEDIVIPGKQVRLADQQGNPLTGIVLEKGLEKIKIDFNHPMAGKDLHFAGKVIEVRKATQEELNHGHVHGPGGHHH